MATLSLWVGWRGALMAVGIAGLLLAVFVASERSELVTARHHHAAVRPKAGVDAHMLLSTPILMAFTYFTLLALAGGAAQNFFPSMLPKVQQVTFQLASAITTFYLSASAFGSFAGGYVADMTQDHERIVGAGLLTAAVLALLIGFVPMPTLLLFVVATMMGFLSGLTVPSRDMLVRAATPPGATGKVFGFVYSGLDLGSLVAPLVAGKLIDQELTPLVFMFIAVTLAATVGAAVAVKHSSQPAPARH
jgi:predicted MFS family arabinose efflux permease